MPQVVVIAVCLIAGSNEFGCAECTPIVSVEKINQQLHGTLIDYTNNHGCNNRLPSAVLGECRDLYVYLPPGYTTDRAYSLLFWLHGAFGDENSFLADSVLLALDRQMASGCLPPMVVACPDGTYEGLPRLLGKHSFYVNGRGGRYEDFIMTEVYPFLLTHYSIRPEREAHLITGVSAGGFGAMSLAMKHRHEFAYVAVLAAPLNMRVSNDNDKYFRNFRPDRYRWREEYDPKEVVGKFFGVIHLKANRLLDHAFGPEDLLVENVRRDNPADLLFTEDIQPGELDIYLHYPGSDNFNFDAHAESFIWLARSKGLHVDVEKERYAKHLAPYFSRNQGKVFHWLGQRALMPAPKVSNTAQLPSRDSR